MQGLYKRRSLCGLCQPQPMYPSLPSLLARPCQVLAEVENHLRLDKGILALPSMSLPLPFRQDPRVWASLQSRQVSPKLAHIQPGLTLTVAQWSSLPSRRSYLRSLSTSLLSLPPHVSACLSEECPKTLTSSHPTFTRLTPSRISFPPLYRY